MGREHSRFSHCRWKEGRHRRSPRRVYPGDGKSMGNSAVRVVVGPRNPLIGRAKHAAPSVPATRLTPATARERIFRFVSPGLRGSSLCRHRSRGRRRWPGSRKDIGPVDGKGPDERARQAGTNVNPVIAVITREKDAGFGPREESVSGNGERPDVEIRQTEPKGCSPTCSDVGREKNAATPRPDKQIGCASPTSNRLVATDRISQFAGTNCSQSSSCRVGRTKTPLPSRRRD